MKLTRTILVFGLAAGSVFAQLGVPNFPGMPGAGQENSRARRGRQPRGGDRGQEGGAAAAGVPIPPDSPVFEAFRKLGEQQIYHQRMAISSSNAQMMQMMEQMGFGPAETVTAGDAKQVSIHMMMPLAGKTEDMELRGVLRNGRMAKKWISPGSGRFLKEVDASIAKQLADAEAQYATSIARNLASGPMGWAAAGMDTALAAAAPAMAMKARKTAHDFFEWTCADSNVTPAQVRQKAPPPLTDLKALGEQTLDGVTVTGYEFYVQENGRAQGPMQMFIAKDSGLPMRIGMNEPRMGASMKMDYYGFNEGGDFELPGCLGEK